MTVKHNEEIKTYLIWETPTHKFSIMKEKLEKLKNEEDYQSKLGTLIQKNMKQTVNNIRGEIWEESANEIFSTIASQ